MSPRRAADARRLGVSGLGRRRASLPPVFWNLCSGSSLDLLPADSSLAFEILCNIYLLKKYARSEIDLFISIHISLFARGNFLFVFTV